MSDTQKYQIKLEEELSKVTTELENIGVYNEETGDWVAKPTGTAVAEADPNEQADVVEDWNERRAILSQLETRFNNLKRALQKIEKGTFGKCEVSGENIEEDRLAANPAARTCEAHMDQENTLPY